MPPVVGYGYFLESPIVTDWCHEQNCYGLLETKLQMLLEMVLFKEGILNCRKHLLLRGLN